MRALPPRHTPPLPAGSTSESPGKYPLVLDQRLPLVGQFCQKSGHIIFLFSFAPQLRVGRSPRVTRATVEELFISQPADFPQSDTIRELMFQ